MNKNVIITIKNICITVLIYLLQFVVFPFLLPDCYPNNNESTLIMFVTFFVGFILGFCLITKKIRYWILPHGSVIFGKRTVRCGNAWNIA